MTLAGGALSIAGVAQQKKSTRPPSQRSERIARETSFADISLSRLGVYINHERIGKLAPIGKSVADTAVLVVEDDPDQLALAALRLRTAGYGAHTADSVKALYRQLEKGMPDALLLDIELPDGNGFDVLGTLRSNPKYGRLPVLMVTSRTDPEDVAKGLELGADGYVTKPYSASTLEYVLRYVLKQEVAAAS